MRLFIAIDCKALADQCKEAQSLLHDYRLTDAFHITLAFLGEVASPNDTITSLSKIKHPKFRITLKDTGIFSRGKVVVVKAFGDGLHTLHNMIAEALGLALDKHFSPHVTLGRSRQPILVPKIAFGPHILDVDHFTLYCSDLTKDGPVYTIIKEFQCSND